MICGTCGSQNDAGRKFCVECGAQLAAPCPSCGTPNPGGGKFCGECGVSLGAPATDAPIRDHGRADTRGTGGRATAGQRSLCRPGGLHHHLGEPRRGGRARAPRRLLRNVPRGRRPLRRHDREVHRRRGDGGLGHADRAGGRCRAGGAGRARSGRRGPTAGRGSRRAGPGAAGRRPHRRGRGHPGRQ